MWSWRTHTTHVWCGETASRCRHFTTIFLNTSPVLIMWKQTFYPLVCPSVATAGASPTTLCMHANFGQKRGIRQPDYCLFPQRRRYQQHKTKVSDIIFRVVIQCISSYRRHDAEGYVASWTCALCVYIKMRFLLPASVDDIILEWRSKWRSKIESLHVNINSKWSWPSTYLIISSSSTTTSICYFIVVAGWESFAKCCRTVVLDNL